MGTLRCEIQSRDRNGEPSQNNDGKELRPVTAMERLNSAARVPPPERMPTHISDTRPPIQTSKTYALQFYILCHWYKVVPGHNVLFTSKN